MRSWRHRQQPKMSQHALGEAVGKDGSYVRHFEAGRCNFSIPVAVEVSRVTQIPLDKLLTKTQLSVASGAVDLLAAEGAA